jgi:hypothetical protein
MNQRFALGFVVLAYAFSRQPNCHCPCFAQMIAYRILNLLQKLPEFPVISI